MKSFYRSITGFRIGFFLFVLSGLMGGAVSAQVSGVSASKLITIDATLVAAKTLEAEPSFTYLYGKNAFDNDGKTYPVSLDPDSAVILKDMFFRFTYGVDKNLEIGTFVTANLSSLSFGAKYRFVQHRKFLGVALLGINFSNESNFSIRKTGFFGKFIGIATGVALTNNFTPRLSLDVSAQYQNTFCYEGSLSDDYFLDSDLGYYVFHQTLQLVGGFSFRYNHFKTGNPDAYLLSFHPGITIETGKSFIIVFYTPIDLMGKNVGCFTGFSFAFTLIIH
jgi:hypothetical protein